MINPGSLHRNQVGSMSPAKSLRKKPLSSRDAFRALNQLLMRENALGRRGQKTITASRRHRSTIV
jgi:hypothetical protein